MAKNTCLSWTTALLFTTVAITVEVLCILYGVYALVPQSPWEKRDVTAGVLLLVLSALISVVVAFIVVLPCLICLICFEDEDPPLAL